MSEAVELRVTLARVVDEWQTVAALQGAPLGIPAVYATSLVNDLLASLTGEGEPVAWQVKDYADGWITFYSHERARQEAEEMGGLIRPVYAGPAILALSASGGGE